MMNVHKWQLTRLFTNHKWQFVFVVMMASLAAADSVKDLSGTWRVTGEGLTGEVRLPGTLADAKFGRHMTAADWENNADKRSKGALTREWQYRGKAVYERTFDLTEEEARHPLELVLERVMGYSEVSIDGKAVGTCDSLAVAHVHPIPRLKAGRHVIRLTLDNSNRYNFSEWAHSYGPVMQSVWHGVVGEIALRRHIPLRQARVFASWPANGRLLVEVPEMGNGERGMGNGKRGTGNVAFALRRHGCTNPAVNLDIASVKPSPYRKGFILVELELGYEPEAWSEHHPNLYALTLRDAATDFTHEIRFGFRSVAAHDRAIWINGMKWFMRGNLDCCHFPLTGAPACDVTWWRETFRKLRDEDGINTIRFHSWTPPKAAFDAADEMGMMFVVEAGIWVDRWMKDGSPASLGFGKPIDAFVQRELRAILEMRGNSPSFIALGIGNELGGCDFKVMGDWMNACKAFDPQRLYVASTARDISPADDFMPTHRYPDVGMVRGRFNASTDWDYEDVYGKTRLPTVAHEIGQWPIYVDWAHELARYTGVLRPYNLEHYRDVAKKAGTERFWPRFSMASANLNRLMYKDEVESFMRTPSCAGLQLLSAQDFTGQFEAMVGWRDSFYDLKPSVRGLPPFKDIFNSFPHLARFKKYTWSVGETYQATLVVRNVTEKPIPAGTEFEAAVAGRPPYRVNTFRLAKTINPGDVGVVGEMSLPLTADMAGKKHLLRFGSNFWPFWVFGRAVAPRPPQTASILETSSFEEMVAALARGGKVLYTGKSARYAKAHFKPVYWSTGHFKRANADLSSLGYLVRSDHPALRGFPTEGWADWQWYNLVEDGVKHGLEGLPDDYEPIVMPVSDLHYSTFMGTLFELKVGAGRLMVCGLNLADKTLPEVRALRESVLSYMATDQFDPKTAVDMQWLREKFAPQASAAKQRPAQFADAPVYIAAAVEVDAAERSVAWKPSLDWAERKEGGYVVSGKRRWGAWRDSSGSFWHGQSLTVTLTGTKPVNGTLWVRFRDPNRCGRTGRGTCEGRSFAIPVHQDEKDCAWWAKLPIMREDALDGKIEFSCETLTGPNLMIDRVVLTEDK